jgi:Rrf2 family protein
MGYNGFLPGMTLLSRKGLLAIAAVIDVALYATGRPVSAKMLAARHALPARHLEPVLQALVRVGILKGIRGPRGGYELARERRRISADDILRAAGSIEDAGDPPAMASSALLKQVVIPAVGQAERAFSVALSRINLEELVRQAEPWRDLAI